MAGERSTATPKLITTELLEAVLAEESGVPLSSLENVVSDSPSSSDVSAETPLPIPPTALPYKGTQGAGRVLSILSVKEGWVYPPIDPGPGTRQN